MSSKELFASPERLPPAERARHGGGSGLPIGKGPGTASDIDCLILPTSFPYYQGLEEGLPGLDFSTGIISGVHNSPIEPAIRF